MGIVDIIKNISAKKNISKQKFKEVEEDMKIQRILEERQKSSNRRELEKLMKQKEEDKIKETLDKIHKQQDKEMWKSSKPILGQKMTIMNNDRPILKEKKIFNQKGTMLNKGDNNCFKW